MWCRLQFCGSCGVCPFLCKASFYMLRCLQVYRGVQWMNNAGCRPFDVRPLEVEGFPLVQRRSVYSFWTISGTDVAEPAFLPAGDPLGGFVG